MIKDVREYLKANGLQSLQDEFHIKVTDYPDRVVLNYDQIYSPKSHPICDSCRALILHKDPEWSVMACSFERFLNVGEDPNTEDFPICHCNTRIEQKIDGSIISLYWDEYEERWQPASRSMAYAEGESALGNTFGHIFWRAIQGSKIIEWLNSNPDNRALTWVFELVSPETRVVTPFTEYKVFLTAARYNKMGQEFCGIALDHAAEEMGVARPEQFHFRTLDEAVEAANSLPSMQEGFVLVYEGQDFYWRIKCKNSKYLAIANMRANGVISAKRILTLIMANDHHEYLNYFPEDQKYFDFVEQIFKSAWEDLGLIWEAHKDKETQKDYALAIIPCCKYDWQKGVLFNLRKGMTWGEAIKGLDPKKLSNSMNLRQKLKEKFAISLDEEE